MVSEVLELSLTKSFGEDVGHHEMRWAVLELQASGLDHFSNPVVLDFDMFGLTMEHRLGSQVYGTKVIAE